MPSENIVLTPQQQLASEKFSIWWEKLVQSDFNFKKLPQVFRIFGYAGTGKTFSAKTVVSEHDLDIAPMAFTGKAALVMEKAGFNACTIHSGIYKYERPDLEYYKKRLKDLEEAPFSKQAEIRKELEDMDKPRFILNTESSVVNSDLILLDEVSMVNSELRADLEYFKKPILVLGDPGQLPPIKGEGAFDTPNPEVMLTDIRRQALDNPIIKWATWAREGRPIPFADEGNAKKIRISEMTEEMVFGVDQILVGKNATRKSINRKYRDFLGINRNEIYPKVGERLICLRNDREKGLFNGLSAIVLDIEHSQPYLNAKLKLETGDEIKCKIHTAHFNSYVDERALDFFTPWNRRDAQEFDFSYAITVHKAQGSQWDNVLFYEERFGFDFDTRRRWTYTAVTRAAENLIIVG